MSSAQKKPEICLLALRGKCRAAGDCPRFHAENHATALWEHSVKKTTQVCTHHLRGSCSRGSPCPCLHVLPKSNSPTPAACEAAARRDATKGSKGEPRRPVPRVVRLASQVRGKAKLFEELTAAYARLARAAGPESGYSQRALDAECQKKIFEAELELMAARLETAIQSYTRCAASDSTQGVTPPLLLTRPQCDPDEETFRSVLR